MSFDEEAAYGQCVGTLRWTGDGGFPRVGRWPKGEKPPVLTGWRDYLQMRLPPDPKDPTTLRVEPPMIDGLSYPLSLLFALQQLRLRPPQPGPLHLLIAGASSKAEERLTRDSDYWQEVGHFFPGASIELVFVGPEIAPSTHGKTTQLSPTLRARRFHGTLGELLAREAHHTAETSLVVGFNTGMGNASAGMAKGGYALMQSWLPDLLAMLRLGLVAIFTCANDYSDLRGELSIFNTLHAELILPPQRNPFKAATVVRESDEEKCEWSCSSCFYYAVCGRADGAPPLPKPGADLSDIRKALKKMAKKLSQTQTVSAVP